MEDLFSVKDKVCVVTGGTSGIGAMIAEAYVKSGAKVYVASRKADACEETAKRLSEFGTCIGIPANLSSEQGCADLSNAIKENESKVHVLVNNAGATWGAPFEDYPAKAWDRILDLNVKSIFFMIQQLKPLLDTAATKDDPAHIINTSSMASELTGSMRAYAYGPSKAAVNQLTRILAGEFAADNICVNAIAPGIFPSKMTDYMLVSDEAEAAIGKTIPLGRIGRVSDMQGLALFLASKASAFITGAIIPIDGGASVKPS